MPNENATDRAAELPRAYLIGGGIASMAAAAFLIRDVGMAGSAITILEALDIAGGSLDGAGNAQDGYRLRGGRMLESKYLCTFDLFASIPALDGAGSVTDETLRWNEVLMTSSHARLFRDGSPCDAPEFGLTERQILTLEWLVLEPEALLGRSSIADAFDTAFFTTDFWFMWCTTFAFQPWHSAVEFKRYLARFVHMVGGFNRLNGILRTVYNQYESLVLPLLHFLKQQGVAIELGTRVTGLTVEETGGEKRVASIRAERGGVAQSIKVARGDYVLATLGSMTEGSRFGGMDHAAILEGEQTGASWALWKGLSALHPELGQPERFCGNVDQSKWLSFTMTFRDPVFIGIMKAVTGDGPGAGGLITFPQSNWLMSFVIPHQPHFIGQPDNVSVMWGYGLSVDATGNFMKKPMAACSGREIMIELLGHLKLEADAQAILASCVCLPCMMPFITSQFMPRQGGDRPAVIPQGWRNLACIGQFCEMPADVVFTVEYSIRSAQAAVRALTGMGRKPPAVYQGKFDLAVLARAFTALHDVGGFTLA